ncbi:MAG: DUF2254 domain-containing protein [Solirubrobacteraceae bacterium]
MSGDGIWARLASRRDDLRTQLWPLPVLGVLVGLALGIALPRLDRRIDGHLPTSVTSYLFEGGPSAARTLLGAVAGSLITVTALTFSLTVVTLQLASSQFSPRLLRAFTRDRFVHVTLALFLLTFTYALAALRSVRSAADDRAVFVPQIAVTLAFALTVASILGMVLFLAHLAQEIRVETMLRKVDGDARETIRRTLDERQEGCAPVGRPAPRGHAVTLPAGASGFLVQLDEDALLGAAVDADAILLIERSAGSSLVVGTPVGVGWARDGTLDLPTTERLRRRVAEAITAGFERTSVEDIAYGLRQLTDVASKALSPGVNDPTTAVHALGHSSALLCEIAARDLDPRLLRDDDGRVRVALCRPQFSDLLEIALTQPRRYGAADPFVVARLFALLRELAWCVREAGQQVAVSEQLGRLQASVAAQEFDPVENDRLAVLADLVRHAQAGRWITDPKSAWADR